MTEKRGIATRLVVNPWDVLIGLCYGTQIACVGLRAADRIGPDIALWGSFAFLLGVMVQIARIYQSNDVSRDVPYIKANMNPLDLVIGLLLGTQLVFLILDFAGFPLGRLTSWARIAGMVALGFIVSRHRGGRQR